MNLYFGQTFGVISETPPAFEPPVPPATAQTPVTGAKGSTPRRIGDHRDTIPVRRI